jgi:hypothetical protein
MACDFQDADSHARYLRWRAIRHRHMRPWYSLMRAYKHVSPNPKQHKLASGTTPSVFPSPISSKTNRHRVGSAGTMPSSSKLPSFQMISSRSSRKIAPDTHTSMCQSNDDEAFDCGNAGKNNTVACACLEPDPEINNCICGTAEHHACACAMHDVCAIHDVCGMHDSEVRECCDTRKHLCGASAWAETCADSESGTCIIHGASDKLESKNEAFDHDVGQTMAQHDQKLHSESGQSENDATTSKAFLCPATQNRRSGPGISTESGQPVNTNPENPVFVPSRSVTQTWPNTQGVNWREFFVMQYLNLTLARGGYLEEQMKIKTAMAKASGASAFYSQEPVSRPTVAP